MSSPMQPSSANAAVLPAYKLAMRRLASTVTIITTSHEGRRYGMAATAVNSVTTAPPTLLACINQTASIHAPMAASGRFCINLLGHEHEHLVPVFSGQAVGEDRFANGEWLTHETGLPFLADAQASIFGVTTACIPYGSHSVFIGEVEAVRLFGEARPLIYQEGQLFRTVGLDPLES
jgi:flavin reductase